MVPACPSYLEGQNGLPAIFCIPRVDKKPDVGDEFRFVLNDHCFIPHVEVFRSLKFVKLQFAIPSMVWVLSPRISQTLRVVSRFRCRDDLEGNCTYTSPMVMVMVCYTFDPFD